MTELFSQRMALFYRILWVMLIVTIPLVFIFNAPLFEFLNCKRTTAWYDWFFLILTSLADGLWVVMCVAVLQTVVKREIRVFIWALILGSLILHTIKYFADAPRPLSALGETLVCVLGQPLTARSFPSGHSFSAVLFFMYLRPRRSLGVGLLFLAITLLAVISRAYVGAHFPRDMVAGAVIAVVAYWFAERLTVLRKTILPEGTATQIGLTVLGGGATVIYLFFYHEKTQLLTPVLNPLAYALLVFWVAYALKSIYLRIRQQRGGIAK